MASRVLVFGVGVIGFARTEGCIFVHIYIYICIFFQCTLKIHKSKLAMFRRKESFL